MAFILAACSDKSGVPKNGDDTVVAPTTDSTIFEENNDEPYNALDNKENSVINPYLSIVGRRINPNYEEYVWDEVYFTYDLITNELREICVLPHFSGYTAGVVSLKENAVYFSMREDIDSNDQIFRYDIQSGEMSYIENKNTSYNDITIIDPDTLLVIAVNDHNTMPALFDLRSATFTYMSDVNGEPFDMFTTGGQLLNYNYLFDTFPWLYFKLSDRYSDGYTGHEEAIDYNFVPIVSADLKKTDDIFTTQLMATHQIGFFFFFSENVILVKLTETIWDESIPSFISVDTYYHLTFDDENTSFIEIDNPFPKASGIVQALTFDGGKIYYCRGYYSVDDEEAMFTYNCETDEITYVLAENDGIISVANFRVVGF
jgi:hypothetical protein